MTDTTAPTTSPLCPVHFPGAQYLGEVVDGFYLGRLAQDSVVDETGVRLNDTAGRYGLFVEDGGCGQLVGLFASTPQRCPISEELDAQIEDANARVEGGDPAALTADLQAAEQEHISWIDAASGPGFRLRPVDGHALVAGAIGRGYQADSAGLLGSFEQWLFDRAGQLIDAAS